MTKRQETTRLLSSEKVINRQTFVVTFLRGSRSLIFRKNGHNLDTTFIKFDNSIESVYIFKTYPATESVYIYNSLRLTKVKESIILIYEEIS